MTIDDLFLEQQLDKMNKLDTAWERFQAEAHDLPSSKDGFLAGVRAAIATALVRVSMLLDRRAGERIFTPTTR
jgi:hypothetical protein